ncbi:hypothetical protein H310_02476 [Aphanomyces invadans]|uniref:Major facilitator superfamily (MFS) profile domain-containing protein n=1 Tax=Aphanomyces invadans TaxID=157072 RepID=A0A024UNV8_9STRA|nr:hypothetical protein H310_02476 [Aphanomyces invadans]ETW08136.1 hypothetical protein H310_02476 [Aphanomyces invadans]|eukprot:XP_008864229.1 hypothetical protein H310_02476 [Aphanomyces invadans]
MPPTDVFDASADDGAATASTSATDTAIEEDIDNEANSWVDLNIHEALQMVGYGKFQQRLLLVSGLMFMADAVEVMLLSFLQVLVKDEWQLTSTQQAGITAAVFAGELPGALFWGFFADRFGRRMGFLLSALCIAIFGILSAFVPDVSWLMVCRAMVGFGVSGALVPFDLMAEFLPDNERARVLLLFQLYWTVGIAFVAVVAWVVIESWGWRWLTGLCATPLVLVLLSFPWMPESPKWLVDQRRYDEAIHVLHATAHLNGTTLPSALRIKPSEPTKYHKLPRRGSRGVLTELCGPALRRVSAMLFLIWFGFGLSYYGYVPQVHILMLDLYDDCTASGITLICRGSENSIILLFPRIFQPQDGNAFNYTCIFLAALAEVLGVFLTMAIVDKMGRRQTQIALYFLCALAVMLSAFELNLIVLTMLAMAARAFIMGASSTTWLATPEAFPTHVRTSGHGIASAMCRMGGFITPFIADSESMSVAAVCAVYGTCLLLTTAASALLPPDTIDPDGGGACELVALTSSGGESGVSSASTSSDD